VACVVYCVSLGSDGVGCLVLLLGKAGGVAILGDGQGDDALEGAEAGGIRIMDRIGEYACGMSSSSDPTRIVSHRTRQTSLQYLSIPGRSMLHEARRLHCPFNFLIEGHTRSCYGC
jgi:hypothetical protein